MSKKIRRKERKNYFSFEMRKHKKYNSCGWIEGLGAISKKYRKVSVRDFRVDLLSRRKHRNPMRLNL